MMIRREWLAGEVPRCRSHYTDEIVIIKRTERLRPFPVHLIAVK